MYKEVMGAKGKNPNAGNFKLLKSKSHKNDKKQVDSR